MRTCAHAQLVSSRGAPRHKTSERPYVQAEYVYGVCFCQYFTQLYVYSRHEVIFVMQETTI